VIDNFLNNNKIFFYYHYPSKELSYLLYQKVKPHINQFEDETGKWESI